MRESDSNHTKKHQRSLLVTFFWRQTNSPSSISINRSQPLRPGSHSLPLFTLNSEGRCVGGSHFTPVLTFDPSKGRGRLQSFVTTSLTPRGHGETSGAFYWAGILISEREEERGLIMFQERGNTLHTNIFSLKHIWAIEWAKVCIV